MPWENSDRKQRLPRNWHTLRLTVLRRDEYKCAVCRGKATDVDHIVHGDDHSLDNLQALCSKHHAVKSAGEGGRAAAIRRKQIRQRFRRPPEKHPGLI